MSGPTFDSSNPHQAVLDTVAAHPYLEPVGDLARLLAALPQDTPLTLDHHGRVAPEYRDQPVLQAVTPRIVAIGDIEGDQPMTLRPGLELGTVLVPETDDTALITAQATRRNLLPAEDLARVSAVFEDADGTLREGLEAAADSLDLLGHVVGQDVGKYVPDENRDLQDSLRIEGARIDSAAARVRALVDQVVTAAEGPTD